MKSKTPAVRAAIEERYGARAVLPYGVPAQLAKEFGLTRERVRQIVNAMGKPHASNTGRRVPRPHCASCDKEMWLGSKVLLCRDCKWIEIPCSECEKPKRVLASRYVTLINRPAQPTPDGKGAHYTGRVFCNRSCWARWNGLRNRGKTHRKRAEAAS